MFKDLQDQISSTGLSEKTVYTQVTSTKSLLPYNLTDSRVPRFSRDIISLMCHYSAYHNPLFIPLRKSLKYLSLKWQRYFLSFLTEFQSVITRPRGDRSAFKESHGCWLRFSSSETADRQLQFLPEVSQRESSCSINVSLSIQAVFFTVFEKVPTRCRLLSFII